MSYICPIWVKIELWGIYGDWYTIYHHLPAVKGVNKPLYSSTNQWEKDIYGLFDDLPF